MIDGGLYSIIYYSILTLITLWLTLKYAKFPVSRVRLNVPEPSINSIWLLIIVIIFFGFRPLHSSFVDMWNYISLYNHYSYVGFRFRLDAPNLIFDNIMCWMAASNINISYFFFLISIIYFSCMWVACRRWFPNDTLYAFVILLSAFSTFSYGTNGIKAGAAASLFLLALTFCEKKWISIFFALLSWGFHHSMHVVIVVYILSFFIRDPKYFLYGWIICVLFAAAHFNPLRGLMISLTDEQGIGYLTSENSTWGGKTGFRLDFLIYGAVPIVIGYYTIFMLKIHSSVYNLIFKIYVGVNALWVLCMYIPFNNRIAYLSWFMLPIVSIYPMLKLKMQQEQYHILNIVVWIYLLFSLISKF